MKYNTVTVHCASLCLDVLALRHFYRYTTPDILAFRPEVAQQITVRLEPVVKALPDALGMVETLASAVINVLLHYHFTRGRISADLIMDLIQNRLEEFLVECKSRCNTYGIKGQIS